MNISGRDANVLFRGIIEMPVVTDINRDTKKRCDDVYIIPVIT